MKKIFRRLNLYSIQARLTFLVSLIIFTLLTFLLLIIQFFASDLLKKQLIQRGELVADNLVQVIIQPLLNRDEIGLEQTVGLVTHQHDILFLKVFDDKGRELNSKIRSEPPLNVYPDSKILSDLKSVDRLIFYFFDENPRRIEIIKPIRVQGQFWGSIYLGLDAEPYFLIISRIRWISVALGSLLILIGLMSVRRISERVMSPIKDLVQGTEEVSNGNFGYQIKVSDEGELGQLARKFNEMTLQLNYYYKQKEILNKKLQKHFELLEERIKERTEQIRRIKEEVVAIFQQIPIGLLVLGPDHTVRWYNDEFLKILSIESKKSIVGKNFLRSKIINNETLLDQLRQKLIDGSKSSFQFVYNSENRKTLVLQIQSQPLNLENASDGYVFVIKDITRESEMERKINRMQRLESMGVLASGIAHDFNNILAIIMPSAQMLKMKMRDENGAMKYVDTIEQAAERASQLTNQILSFARGSKSGKITVTDLNAVVVDFIAMFRRVTDRKIEIKTDLSENLWKVEVDRGQIEQVLMNLSVNARDAMPGGGQIDYRTDNIEISESVSHFYPGLLPGKYVLLEIRDTGVGIPQDKLDKIFDPFFSDKKGKGTGLGLSLVYGIVKGYGGFIDVTSEVNKGTKFSIYLPATFKEFSEEEEKKSTITLEKGKILLVDDEELLQETVSKLLESLDFEVVIARNGQEAVEKYEKMRSEIDLILMDLQMPVMDGFEAADKIWEKHPDARIVFSSGYADPGKIQELKKRGVKHFLKKPYKLQELVDIISNVIRN